MACAPGVNPGWCLSFGETMHPLAKELQWCLDNDIQVDGKLIVDVIQELNKIYKEKHELSTDV